MKATPSKIPPSARRSRSLSGSLVRLLVLLIPFVLAAAVAYVGYQDRMVREQFEGKRWALPARVYAGAPEIFVGSSFDAEGFEWLLGQLKYRKDPQLSTQGTYIRLGDEIVFRTRDFKFWDKPEPRKTGRKTLTRVLNRVISRTTPSVAHMSCTHL